LYKNHTYKILDLRYKRKCAVYPCDRIRVTIRNRKYLGI